MAEGVVIRPERDADHPVIAEVVRAAFVGHPDEVASFVERIANVTRKSNGSMPTGIRGRRGDRDLGWDAYR